MPLKVTVQTSLAARNGPLRVAKLPDRQAGRVVHAIDGVDREPLEQPLLDHRPAAAEPLLRGLEDEMHVAAEIAVLGEIARRAEQHRGMAVVAAGVHLAGNGRADARGPSISWICSASRSARSPIARWPGRLPFERADDAGLADALGDLDAPGAQLLGDQRGGAHLLEAGLGMAVDVAADLDQFGLVGLQLVDDVVAHESSHFLEF